MGVVNVEPSSEMLAGVRQLYRRHADVLGFMPEGAFVERAERSMLLAEVGSSGVVRGYALFDLPARHVSLRQLCVDPAARASGIARALVDEIARRHGERLGIRLRCRNDYAASSLWPRLDFEPLHESPGRSTDRRPLTTWWRDFGHPTLFSHAADIEDRRCAAIDTDIFLDLVEDGRPAEARHLEADWVQEHLELVVTKAVPTELHHHEDPGVRERRRTQLSAFPRQDAPTELVTELISALTKQVPPGNDHDRMDIEHVARAAAGGATYFVSRDDALHKRLIVAAKIYGVAVRRPVDVITELAAAAGTGPYAPIQIQDTSFASGGVTPESIPRLASAFVNHGAAERTRDLVTTMRDLAADQVGSSCLVISDAENNAVGIVAWRRIGATELQVPLLRAAGPAQTTIARHLAHLARLGPPPSAEAGAVLITDAGAPAWMRSAAAHEGFVETSRGLLAAPRPGFAKVQDGVLDLAALGLPDPLVAAATDRWTGIIGAPLADDIERVLAPLKILGAGITTYLVPIRPAFAADLFDAGLSAGRLFGRPDHLGMSREHVYYSGSRQRPKLPARIIWYVSRTGPGGGTARAVSRLEEATVDRPLTLYRRFRHLGIWHEEQVVRAAAKSGDALALRFSDTELLPRPVPLAELRGLATKACHALVLQSLTKIPEELFASIYERGQG